jgi:hypothetical protein
VAGPGGTNLDSQQRKIVMDRVGHCCIELSHAILTVGSPVNRGVDPFEGLRQGACDLSEGRH